jgi:hypothetical protein
MSKDLSHIYNPKGGKIHNNQEIFRQFSYFL